MDLSLGQRMGTEQRIAPKMLAFYNLLAMNAAELEQAIADELSLNPALELASEAECPSCGAVLRGSTCHACSLDVALPPPADQPDDTLEWIETPPPEARRLAGDDSDPLATIPAPGSLRDHLRWALRASAQAQDWPAAEALLDSLDDDGYLRVDMDELAASSGVPSNSLHRALHALQSLDPPGVGARDLRECLLIQLQQLAAAGRGDDLARAMLWEHWDLFSKRRLDLLAKALRRSVQEVQQAADFVRDHLNPYPGRDWRPDGYEDWAPDSVPTARPDVVYVRVDGAPELRFEARLIESPRLFLRLNSIYARFDGELLSRPDVLSSGDRKHVVEHVNRARDFLGNLRRRRLTLKRIADRVGSHQVPFLQHGVTHLLPLTRLQVARELAVHESTVGRAIQGKCALVPDGTVVPFDLFFDTSYPVRAALGRLVAQEDPRRPLTDQQLAERLADAGFQVARRTVAKYREQLRIPAAGRRRRFA